MSRTLTVAESRALRRGVTVTRSGYRNNETGDVYEAELKLSWDKLYYRVNDGPWCRTPGAARRASS